MLLSLKQDCFCHIVSGTWSSNFLGTALHFSLTTCPGLSISASSKWSELAWLYLDGVWFALLQAISHLFQRLVNCGHVSLFGNLQQTFVNHLKGNKVEYLPLFVTLEHINLQIDSASTFQTFCKVIFFLYWEQKQLAICD